MDSPFVGDLPEGARVVVEQRAASSGGVDRCCVIAGDKMGWLSEKLLAPTAADEAAPEAAVPADSAASSPNRASAASLAAVRFTAAVHRPASSALEAADDGPTATPDGSRSHASDAARSALRLATSSAAFRAAAPAAADADADGPITSAPAEDVAADADGPP